MHTDMFLPSTTLQVEWEIQILQPPEKCLKRTSSYSRVNMLQWTLLNIWEKFILHGFSAFYLYATRVRFQGSVTPVTTTSHDGCSMLEILSYIFNRSVCSFPYLYIFLFKCPQIKSSSDEILFTEPILP